ncbi:MAG: formylglycine-generating enzyme family protein [Alphaproteobacteria bacterium]
MPERGRPIEAFDTVPIPGGKALVGTDQVQIPLDGEGPCRSVTLKPFRMTAGTITNAEFAAFVEDTGHVTEAERFGWSFVFHAHVPAPIGETQAVPKAEWWRRVDGAHWRMVNGPGSEAACRDDHPAVHISWSDARAFAAWAGGRLPTEAEWEHAARGGFGDVPYPWGERPPNDRDFFPCNIWQGRFPDRNSAADGHEATAPALSFEPNGYGVFNMCGNVWEWTSEPYKLRSLSKATRRHAREMRGTKLLKGGSYLCHASYCHRYRIAARTGASPDTTTSHQGFRLVFDV